MPNPDNKDPLVPQQDNSVFNSIPRRTLDNLVIADTSEANSDAVLVRALERILEVAKAGAIQTKDQDAAQRFAWIMGRARGQLLRIPTDTAPATSPSTAVTVAISREAAVQVAIDYADEREGRLRETASAVNRAAYLVEQSAACDIAAKLRSLPSISVPTESAATPTVAASEPDSIAPQTCAECHHSAKHVVDEVCRHPVHVCGDGYCETGICGHKCGVFPTRAEEWEHIWLRETREENGWKFGYYADRPQDDAFIEYARVHQCDKK